MKTIIKILLVVVFTLSIIKESSATEIKVAVAANFAPAFTEIVKVFNKDKLHDIKIIIGGSGSLTTKIINGAPFDIFLSANTAYPEKLYLDKKIKEKPVVYATGKLTLWSLYEKNTMKLTAITDLKNKTFKKIAIASPVHAPYGKAAIETLKNANIYEDIKNKLVFGESIAQVNQFLITKTADAGFVPNCTVILHKKGQSIKINSNLYSPITQAMILLTDAKEENYMAAKELFTYITSPSAKKIITDFGYQTNEYNSNKNNQT